MPLGNPPDGTGITTPVTNVLPVMSADRTDVLHLEFVRSVREMVPELSKKAMEDACHLLNPRPCTQKDMTALYERAL
jgi:hypothetical protein